jgi:hypothetical protein
VDGAGPGRGGRRGGRPATSLIAAAASGPRSSPCATTASALRGTTSTPPSTPSAQYLASPTPAERLKSMWAAGALYSGDLGMAYVQADTTGAAKGCELSGA